ncbi:MAG: DUF6077 domain-containing protein, partial [Nocardioidaceae bacterium]
SRRFDRYLVPAACLFTGAAALLMAFGAWFPLVTAAWWLAGVPATVWAARRVWSPRPHPSSGHIAGRTPDDPDDREDRSDSDGLTRSRVVENRSALVALAWGLAMAASTVFMLRPNPDDVYYVNLSQWVAAHGVFPLRDTIFANLVYPMTSWPPMASYDALAGSLAHLLGTRAAFVDYIVLPPVTALLSVLALWRLLRVWRVTAVSTALSAALVFLLLDGVSSSSPGNLFVTRLFQGKIVFMCLMVPLLLVYALRYVERPTRARAGWLLVAGVAAVGVTTSAMFLTPLIAAAGVAPLLRRSRRLALLGFAAMSAYPLAAGVVTKAVGGRSGDDFLFRFQRYDPSWFGHTIFDYGVPAVIVVAAVLLGILLVPNPRARVTTGVLVLFMGVTFIPGVTQLSFDLIGLGPTLLRVSWIVSMAALVGVLVTWWTGRFARPAMKVAGPLALVVLLGAFGAPLWAGARPASLAAPFHYQRAASQVQMAEKLISRSRPGAVVLAPQELSITVTVLTTRIHTLVPRAYIMANLHHDPRFHYNRRQALNTFATGYLGWRPAAIKRDLHLLGVDTVCLPADRPARLRAVRRYGYRKPLRTSVYTCLTR